jgi:hypothetical protein
MFTVLRPRHLSDGGALIISSTGIRILRLCLQLQIYYYYYYHVSTCDFLLSLFSFVVCYLCILLLSLRYLYNYKYITIIIITFLHVTSYYLCFVCCLLFVYFTPVSAVSLQLLYQHMNNK